jgi:hypothetical protein
VKGGLLVGSRDKEDRRKEGHKGSGNKGSKLAQEEQERPAQQIKENAGWLAALPRLGYLTRGLLYGAVGWLAFQMVIGVGGYTTDLQGAISYVADQRFGQLALVVIAFGLVGYSLWGFARAILDPLARGTSPKALAERGGYFVSGVAYASLLFPTVRLLLGGDSDEGQGQQASADWTAWLLSQPYGPWLVGGIGLVAGVGAVGQAYMGLAGKFMKDFRDDMTENEERAALWAGRIGMVARGVVFAVVAWFFVQSALQVDASEPRGLDGALLALLMQPYGPWLMGTVALGLISFGVFSALSGRWIKLVKTKAEAAAE